MRVIFFAQNILIFFFENVSYGAKLCSSGKAMIMKNVRIEMGNVKSHEDLLVWQISIDFVTSIYKLTKDFPKTEIYGLTNQMRRAAVSIPSNIAEGAARNSTKEYIQFLYIALGSVSEIDTQLIISKNLGFADNSELRSEVKIIKGKLINLIASLKRRLK